MNGNGRPIPRRSSVVDKYTTGRSRETETGGVYDLVESGSTPSGIDGDQVRQNLCYSEHTIGPDALRLILRNGDRHGFLYHFLERTFLNGSGRLILYYSMGRVIVEGTNLDEVEPILLERRIGYLKEADRRFAEGDASEQTLITRVGVEIQED